MSIAALTSLRILGLFGAAGNHWPVRPGVRDGLGGGGGGEADLRERPHRSLLPLPVHGREARGPPQRLSLVLHCGSLSHRLFCHHSHGPQGHQTQVLH